MVTPGARAVLALAALLVVPAGATAAVVRVSMGLGGAEADAASVASVVSADGRVVAFTSAASNLVAGDANGVLDVFVYDRVAGAIERVSVGGDGQEAAGSSAGAAVSRDGRIVAFASAAENLVARDGNGVSDIFVRDRVAGTTECVSVRGDGGPADGASFGMLGVSADGRFVAFRSVAADLVAGDTNGVADVFVRDRRTGTTERVSVGVRGQGTGMSFWPALSADGRVVAFASAADDLVAADANREIDVFVRDRVAGVTERVSVGYQGRETTNVSLGFPALSADGTLVAFTSRARELLPDGEDTNGRADILVRDRTHAVTTRVSVPTGGGQADAGSVEAALAGDGGTVVFYSAATNLAPGDRNGVFDVFRHERASATTTRLTAGDAATFVSGGAVSADGGVVTFYGAATNLVPGDTNGVADVFVWTP